MPQWANDDDDDVMLDTRGHKDRCPCKECTRYRQEAKRLLTDEEIDDFWAVFGRVF